MKKTLIASLFASLLFMSTGSYATDKALSLHEINVLSQNAPALIAVLGNPDKISHIKVGNDAVHSGIWTYKSVAVDGGILSDLHVFFADDGFAVAVAVNGVIYRVHVRGNETFGAGGTPLMSTVVAPS